MLVKGIDVSYYDDVLSWQNYDADFAFIKCCEGVVIDKVFKTQWREAKGRTIRGAYHFFRAFVNPVDAAKKFAEFLNGDTGELPPVIDLETSDGDSEVMRKALTFAQAFQTETHVKPMFYSSPGFLTSHNAHLYTDYGNYKLWLASYPFDRITMTWKEEQREKMITDIWEGRFLLAFPPPPRPFKRVSFFQFTGKGNPMLIGGYTSSKEAVDLNLYNGNSIQSMFQEFDILYVPRNEDEPMATIYGKVNAKTNIRNGPYDTFTDIGDLLSGYTIQSDQFITDVAGRKWYHLIAAFNTSGGAVLTTTGKQVSETPSWCFGGNITEYIPTSQPPVNRKIINIEINNPERVIIHYDDGTSISHP